MTADNTFNNNTLRRQLSKLLADEGIEWDHDVNTVNCMAHVIQLSVNQLLQNLKAAANNDTLVTVFDDSDLRRIDRTEISFGNTLKKVRIVSISNSNASF